MAGSAPDPHVTQPHFPVVVTHRSLPEASSSAVPAAVLGSSRVVTALRLTLDGVCAARRWVTGNLCNGGPCESLREKRMNPMRDPH